MSEFPKYTVIIPSYHSNEDRLLRLLTSLKTADTMKQAEILLIHHLNFPYSKDLNKKLRSMDIKIIENNSGVSGARNLGIENAQGEYLLFCDDDDYVESRLFSELNKALIKNPDLVLYGFNKLMEDSDHSSLILPYDGSNFDRAICRQYGGGLCWNKAYRRQFLIENSLFFNSDLILAEDIEFTCRIAGHNPSWQTISTPLYNYIVRPGSVSQRYRSDLDVQYQKSMKIIFSNPDISNNLKNEILLEHLIYTALKFSFRKEHGGRKKNREDFRCLLKEPPYNSLFNQPLVFSDFKFNILYQLIRFDMLGLLEFICLIYQQK